MKRLINVLTALTILTSCQNKVTDNKLGDQVISTQTSIYIKDSSDYSIDFLDELGKSGIQNVSLIDSMSIINGGDTMYFPQCPTLGKKTVLTAKKDELAIALTIERINQTTIDYKLEMVEFGKANFNKTGKATIFPHFYLDSETNESSLSGVSYAVDQYNDHQDTCYTYIRLGKEESGSYLMGKLIKNCNGKIKNIEFDNFPTLVEK